MSLVRNPNLRPLDVVDIIPVWLEIEKDYANAKHGVSNPQVTALSGGLRPGELAYQDFSNYFGRFRYFASQANGNEMLMVKASQQLGKFVSVGRALLRVCLQERDSFGIGAADEKTLDIIEDRLVFLSGQESRVPLDFDDDVLYPALAAIDSEIGVDISMATDLASALVVEQSRLFVGYTALTGILATPGINSTDEDSQLGVWCVTAP